MHLEKKMEIGGTYLFRKSTLILTMSDEVMS
jgi:hypothetical protein